MSSNQLRPESTLSTNIIAICKDKFWVFKASGTSWRFHTFCEVCWGTALFLFCSEEFTGVCRNAWSVSHTGDHILIWLTLLVKLSELSLEILTIDSKQIKVIYELTTFSFTFGTEIFHFGFFRLLFRNRYRVKSLLIDIVVSLSILRRVLLAKSFGR